MAAMSQLIPKIEVSVERFLLIVYPVVLLPIFMLLYFEFRGQKESKVQPRGCKMIGMRGYSNVKDEYDDRKYAQGVEPGQDDSGEPRWKIKAIFIYPIKSCAAIELNVADFDSSGVKWDRKFAFAELLQPPTRVGEAEKKPIWTFRTQRQPGFEKLVHVKCELWVPDAEVAKVTQEADKDGVLIIKYPKVATRLWQKALMWLGFLSSETSFRVPLSPPSDHSYPLEDVAIWKDTPKWLNYGEYVPDDFKAFLGTKHPLTLFRVDPGSEREVFRCAPDKKELGYQVVIGFADAYPLHLLNLASVRHVARKVQSEIPMFSARRFRSNILLSGPAAFDEDDWKYIRLGQHEFFCSCHTVRCRLPNVDPDSSERHPEEPDKTLKEYRCIDDGDPKNACLGLQLVPAKAEGIRLRVGDGVEVLKRGEHFISDSEFAPIIIAIFGEFDTRVNSKLYNIRSLASEPVDVWILISLAKSVNRRVENRYLDHHTTFFDPHRKCRVYLPRLEAEIHV